MWAVPCNSQIKVFELERKDLWITDKIKVQVDLILMMMVFLVWMITLVLILCSPAHLEGSYRAAIVQLEKQAIDVKEYIPFVKEASDDKAEIVVFPELGDIDYSWIEEIVVGSCPNNEHDKPIQSVLSLAAKENQMYIVFNMIAKGEKCDHPEPYCNGSVGYFVYNTAVAIDRNGCILEKYLKHHPFENTGVGPYKPGPPTISYFDTDFGVRFGMFICYDISWKIPAGDMVREYKINNIIFPTHWIDTLFIFGSSIQQGYSEYFQVNLLASNSLSMSRGSGVYSKGNPLVVNDSKITKLLIADIPKMDYADPPKRGKSKKFPWKEETKWDFFQVTDDLITKGTSYYTSQLDTHKCFFSVRASTPTGEYFKFGAIRITTGGIPHESCVLLNCGSKKPSYSSSSKEDWFCENDNPMTVFSYLSLNITTSDNIRMVLPMPITTGRSPFKSFEKIRFLHKSDFHQVVMSSVDEPVASVCFFGVINDT